MRRWITTAALAAGVLVGAIAGATFGPTLAGAADDTDPMADAPRPLMAWVEEALDPLVSDGTLTQGQADAVIDALREARPVRGHHGPWLGRYDLDEMRTRLGEAVQDGRLTQEQADRMLEHMEARREAIERGEWPRGAELRDRMRDRLRDRATA